MERIHRREPLNLAHGEIAPLNTFPPPSNAATINKGNDSDNEGSYHMHDDDDDDFYSTNENPVCYSVLEFFETLENKTVQL